MAHSLQLFAVEAGGIESLRPPVEARSVHEVFDAVEGGVYTGMRTFRGTDFVGLDEHLDRLQNCMDELGWEEALDRDELRRALHAIVTAAREEPDASNARGPAGRAPAEHFLRIDFLPPGAMFQGVPRKILIAVGPLVRVPPEFLENGVQVEIAENLRRDDPRVKLSSFVPQRRPYPLGTREAFEHLLVDERGAILEGTSSNFYALENGVLRTAGQGVLPGITRRFLVFLCSGFDIPIHMQAVHVDELASLDEAFLTSATRGIVPIVGVAGTPIGDGRPGQRTRELMAGYEALTCRSARPAWPAQDEGDAPGES